MIMLFRSSSIIEGKSACSFGIEWENVARGWLMIEIQWLCMKRTRRWAHTLSLCFLVWYVILHLHLIHIPLPASVTKQGTLTDLGPWSYKILSWSKPSWLITAFSQVVVLFYPSVSYMPSNIMKAVHLVHFYFTFVSFAICIVVWRVKW